MGNQIAQARILANAVVDRLIADCAWIRSGLLRNQRLNAGQEIRLLLENANYLLCRHRLLIRYLARLLVRRLAGLLVRRLAGLLVRRLAGLLIWRLISHLIRSLGNTHPGSAKSAKHYDQSESKQETADSVPSRPGVKTPMVIKHNFAHHLTF